MNVTIGLRTPENLCIGFHRAKGRKKFNFDGRRRRRRKVAVIDLTATPQVKTRKEMLENPTKTYISPASAHS